LEDLGSMSIKKSLPQTSREHFGRQIKHVSEEDGRDNPLLHRRGAENAEVSLSGEKKIEERRNICSYIFLTLRNLCVLCASAVK